jgi:hypothetical protein
MPDEGFGAGLWKNVRAIRLARDGGIEAPVRANHRDGVVVGLDQVAEADARAPAQATREPRRTRWWTRWRRR